MRKLISLLFSLLVVFSLSVPALAAGGSVTYDGKARAFIFEPGSKQSPTDLFTEFKGVMPGDQLTQRIAVQNKLTNFVNAKIYIRAKGAVKGSEEFLSQMTLTVKKNGRSLLYQAPADETAQLTDWVCLGTVRPGGKIYLDVTLNVPIEMGNEFQDAIGYLDWEFKVEEIPIDVTNPKTGDIIWVYAGVLALSTAALVVVFAVKLKKRLSK